MGKEFLAMGMKTKREKMTNANEAYDKLVAMMRETAVLGSCSSVLSWDRQTCMPRAGGAHRAEQLTLLAGLAHERATATEIDDLLSACEESELVSDPLSVAAVNVREWRHDYAKRTKLPKDLVKALTKTTSLAHEHWVAARAENDFPRFAPWLGKIVTLVREKAAAYGGDSLYDALLDDFEPGETTENVQRLFGELRAGLVPLIAAAAESTSQPQAEILTRDFPVDRQKLFSKMAVGVCGYSHDWGRIDEVVHPFCTSIGPGDTRITTRYNPKFFNESLFGCLHEMGHALYCTGHDPAYFGSPMGNPTGLAIHESQSRMWENFVGRSRAYWQYLYPQAQGMFPEALGEVAPDDFYKAINRIAPTFIRVEADEATYNLHVVLRFELEQALIAGDLAVADVPAAWNEKFKELLGLEVPDDTRGCLQDTHWSSGMLGYFPTYALGNIYAAQIFAQVKKDIPDLEEGFMRGEFAPLLTWLRENIHRQGRRYRGAALIKKLTGSELSVTPLVEHLRHKLTLVYGLDVAGQPA